jgi:hypothetical protein
MKKTFTLLTFLFLLISYSQKNTVVSGGVANGSTGSVSYSIGQIDYTSQISGTGFVSQGVQQPYEVIVLSENQNIIESVIVSVYPNPTKDIASIFIKDFTNYEKLEFQLIDSNGKIIFENQRIISDYTAIDLSILTSGIYILKLMGDGKMISTFKMIKN